MHLPVLLLSIPVEGLPVLPVHGKEAALVVPPGWLGVTKQ